MMETNVAKSRRNWLKTRDIEGMDEYYKKLNFKSTPYKLNIKFFLWDWSPAHRKIRSFLKPGSVLDDGGGFGPFRPYCEGMKYINLDPCEGMLKDDPGPEETKIVGAGENLPFPDAHFDNVVSIAVLRLVSDDKRYLQEAYRVLKPGGIFVLVNATSDYPDNLKTNPFLFWVPYIYNYQKARVGEETRWKEKLMPRAELIALIESAGFKIKQTERVTKHLPWIWKFKPDSRLMWALARLFMRKKHGQYQLVVCERIE